jgi:hypothetical protein
MADLTEEQLSALNAALLPLDEAVMPEEREGTTVYWLCKLTPRQEIDDITAFAQIYGIA